MTPYEYFCKECGQLRLCLDPNLEGCGNCGSMRIIYAAPGCLPKDQLKENFKRGRYKVEERKEEGEEE